MNRRVNLQDLVDKKVITAAGRDWFLCATDPFHDFDHPLSGYPDSTHTLSIVTRTTKTLEISKPGACAGNWDCLVSMFPFVNTTSAAFANCHIDAQKHIEYDSTATYNIGTLTAFAADAGVGLLPDGPAWAPSNYNVSYVNGLTEIQAGRVVGLAFEVHNTTAEIYQQGTVTCAEVPTTPMLTLRKFEDTNGATVGTREHNCVSFNGPPCSLAQAAKYPTMRQWKAKDGCLCVASFSDMSNPGMRFMPAGGIMGIGNNEGNNNADMPGIVPGTSADVPATIAMVNMNMPFAYFTGLSNETTLTLTLKLYYEAFPGPGDSTLQLASPSPPMDPKAFQLYSYAVHHVPLCVPVTHNSTGTFSRHFRVP
jgi:hypothetical protein